MATAPCPRCKKLVGLTSFGRCMVCGDVISASAAPTADSLLAWHHLQQKLAPGAALVFAVTGIVVLKSSVIRDEHGRTGVLLWGLAAGIALILAAGRLALRWFRQ
jgi:hypothetical protein